MKSIIFIGVLITTVSTFASEIITHNVSVRQGFSVNSCAREIQAKTSADIVEILTTIGVISIKSSDRDAARVAKLRCVESIEKNETASGYR